VAAIFYVVPQRVVATPSNRTGTHIGFVEGLGKFPLRIDVEIGGQAGGTYGARYIENLAEGSVGIVLLSIDTWARAIRRVDSNPTVVPRITVACGKVIPHVFTSDFACSTTPSLGIIVLSLLRVGGQHCKFCRRMAARISWSRAAANIRVTRADSIL